jgi:hypothetical protein
LFRTKINELTNIQHNDHGQLHFNHMTNTHSPILLFGMPRSGTTWIGKIFDSSPSTLYRHEPDSWGTLNAVPLFPNIKDAESYRPIIGAFLDGLPSARKTKVAASLPIFMKAGESNLSWKLRSAAIVSIKAISRYMGEISVPEFLDRGSGSLRPVWKSIESTARLGIIRSLFPEVRAVHILRHPCGYVASVLRGEDRHKFEGGRDSEDFGVYEMLCQLPQASRRGLDLAAFRAMSRAERLAWRWVIINEKAWDESKDQKGYLPVSYDRICEDSERQARLLFDFAEIEWTKQTESFLSASTGRENEAYYSVFKDPSKSANKWRNELTTGDIDSVLKIAENSPLGKMFE